MSESPVFFFSEKIRLPSISKLKIQAWLVKALEEEKHALTQLCIIFCNDQYLAEMNKRYLKKNTLTDVIAFSYDKPGSKNVYGDVFISIDRVKENATKFNLSFKSELHRVIIHGVLHLCGYEDKTKPGISKMRKTEDHYLRQIN